MQRVWLVLHSVGDRRSIVLPETDSQTCDEDGGSLGRTTNHPGSAARTRFRHLSGWPGILRGSPPTDSRHRPRRPQTDRSSRSLMTDQQDDRSDSEPRRRARLVGRARSSARRSMPFVAGVLATFLALAAYGALNPGPHLLTPQDVRVTIASALASQTPAPPFSQLVYDVVRPSLVLIETDGTDAKGKATHGLGTGVVVDATGDILTALHVVADAKTIQLTFADGSKANGTIAVSRPDTDIAVVQPDQVPAGIPPATLGNPNVPVGSDAYIVGNPFGLTGSMSAGVVSGLGRSFQFPDSDQVIHGLIQVDAAVNPGNSGGPLLNRAGQVIGIVTGLVNPTKEDVFIGIGLAVPIDTAGGAAGLPAY
jgi:hypothetical protein